MSRHIGNPLGSKEFLNEGKKFTKRDFSKLTKQELELLSMGFAMFTDGGPVIDAGNIHFVTPEGLKKTLKGFEKEKRSLAPEGKKLLTSIIKKTKSLVEQYGGEEDEEKLRQMMQAMKQKMGGQMPPEVSRNMQASKIRPMETGAPGAMSADISWKDLAGIAKPPMGGGRPPMPPMGGGRPPMPTMDDQPGLPMKPSAPPQQGQMPPMGGGMPPELMQMMKQKMGGQMPPMGGPKPPMGGQPPSESEGPRSMEPSPDFAQRMGIDKVERHHLRPEEDSYPLPDAKPGAGGGPPGPGMPGMPPGPPRSEGPQEGQPIRPELASDPAAPKEMPQLVPGTTEGSQDFIARYAGQIKSFLKQILDREKEKFARGGDLTAMPKNFKEDYCYTCEQAGNAVGGGMSPVVGDEGEIQGRDKMLGKTGDKRDKFNMMRRASDALDIMAQRKY